MLIKRKVNISLVIVEIDLWISIRISAWIFCCYFVFFCGVGHFLAKFWLSSASFVKSSIIIQMSETSLFLSTSVPLFCALIWRHMQICDIQGKRKTFYRFFSIDRFTYYRKSVLHLLKRMLHVPLSRCSTDLQYILGHSVYPLWLSRYCMSKKP